MSMRPIRFGVRESEAGWHLEVALPARRDQVEDAEDVVERVSEVTFANEQAALSALAYALSHIINTYEAQ